VTSPAATRVPPARVSRQRVGRAGILVLVVVAYLVAARLAEVDLAALAAGVPRMAEWAAKAWPPSTQGLDTLLLRAAETVSMALLGTTLALVLAVPTAVLAARNLTPEPWLRMPVRWLLNVFRGTDAFVFAILFVAAVGLGPFAGVLGVGLHTWGSMAKLFAEAIEGLPAGPLEAVATTGASRLKVVSFALLPDALPGLTSVVLYFLEFNIRASTVLGIVGAGGIGQELKSSMDLLNFPRLFTILVVILALVTVVDQLSSRVRARLG